MNLALFDLDNTLLPLDSDHSWSQYLMDQGHLDPEEFKRKNDMFFADYQAGKLDIFKFLKFQLSPLATNPKTLLDEWHAGFMQTIIEPALRPSAQTLVQKHLRAGDVCVVVTATNSFITRPVVQKFGITHLIATEPAVENGEFTGQVQGLPSFREGKVTRLHEWLSLRNESVESYENIYFYSDSINDLPLLELASHPVATNPDEKLACIARERGWPILELFQ